MPDEPSPYHNYCPSCGKPSVSRTRGIPTYDRCANGHKYLASDGLKHSPTTDTPFDRDTVARIIDPSAFDGSVRNRVGSLDEADLRRQTAYIKADVIVALNKGN